MSFFATNNSIEIKLSLPESSKNKILTEFNVLDVLIIILTIYYIVSLVFMIFCFNLHTPLTMKQKPPLFVFIFTSLSLTILIFCLLSVRTFGGKRTLNNLINSLSLHKQKLCVRALIDNKSPYKDKKVSTYFSINNDGDLLLEYLGIHKKEEKVLYINTYSLKDLQKLRNYKRRLASIFCWICGSGPT